MELKLVTTNLLKKEIIKIKAKNVNKDTRINLRQI